MSEPFGASSTTDDVLSGLDLSGMVVVVTGGSGGLGLETGRSLAAAGAHVVLAARNTAKLDSAVAAIRSAHPDASIDNVVVDLADLRSVGRATTDLREQLDRLDLVINNAGVMCTPKGRTADGFETQFGTNHLGHMAWTLPLIDLLTAEGGGRVINLSSAGHRFSDIDLTDPNFEQHPYDPWVAYGASKTANVLFSVELERRHHGSGVRSIAVHPGGIHTDLGRHMTPDVLTGLQERIAQSNPQGFEWRSIPQGAATTVWAATTPQFDAAGGVYCEDCDVADVVDPNEPGSDGVLAYAVDPRRAEQLWELSLGFLAG